MHRSGSKITIVTVSLKYSWSFILLTTLIILVQMKVIHRRKHVGSGSSLHLYRDEWLHFISLTRSSHEFDSSSIQQTSNKFLVTSLESYNRFIKYYFSYAEEKQNYDDNRLNKKIRKLMISRSIIFTELLCNFFFRLFSQGSRPKNWWTRRVASNLDSHANSP